MSAEAACMRCAEPLVEPERGCVFCRGERITEAVTQLVNAAGSNCDAALFCRVEAICTLRSLGFSEEQVVQARARALDGFEVGEIVEGLEGARELGAVKSSQIVKRVEGQQGELA